MRGASGNRGGFAPNTFEQAVANLVGIAAHSELQLATVWHDVVLAPGMNRSDCHDSRLDGISLAADERLQTEHQLRRHYDRVDGRMRSRAMAAAPVQRDIDTVDVGLA